MKYLLGVDLGTSGTKTVLFDENGEVIASAGKDYPLYTPQNGWAEQKPEDWRDAAIETIAAIRSPTPAQIAATSVASMTTKGTT